MLITCCSTFEAINPTRSGKAFSGQRQKNFRYLTQTTKPPQNGRPFAIQKKIPFAIRDCRYGFALALSAHRCAGSATPQEADSVSVSLRIPTMRNYHASTAAPAITANPSPSTGRCESVSRYLTGSNLISSSTWGISKIRTARPISGKYVFGIAVFCKPRRLNSRVSSGPRYHCVGNHDVDSITKQQFLENIENTGIPKTDLLLPLRKEGLPIPGA